MLISRKDSLIPSISMTKSELNNRNRIREACNVIDKINSYICVLF